MMPGVPPMMHGMPPGIPPGWEQIFIWQQLLFKDTFILVKLNSFPSK